MMQFNVSSAFQSQLARAATFFEGQKRTFTDSNDAKEKARMHHDEFVSRNQGLKAKESTTQGQMK